jgi:aspartyl/asparaginyl beta-hydroxylase (cupin superfamily)
MTKDSRIFWDNGEKLFISIRDTKYEGNLPAFYPPQYFPELNILLDNWQAINEEVMNYEKQIGAIHGINSNPYVSAQFEGVNWSNMYLDNFMWRFHKNRKHFPLICKLVNQIPNCTLTVLTVLSPNTTVKPHRGDTNGIIRCHLGLNIPAPYPICGIRVGQQEQGWEEGKLTLFTEALLHSVWNYSTGKRYLLIVDIVPSFMTPRKLEICSKVLGGQTINYLDKRFPLFQKIPDNSLPVFHFIFAFLWRLYLPIQRQLKFL